MRSQPTAGGSTTTDVGTLRSLGTPLSGAVLLDVGCAVAGALALRHGRSGLHGGVCPDSVLIGPDGQVTLLDAPRGLPDRARYAAPEQSGRLARDVDERADLYALGVVLYELATGARPYPESVYAQLTQAPPPVAGLPAGLAGVLHRLLAVAPEDRYQTARGVLADLRRCQEDLAALGDVDAFPTGRADIPGRPTFTGRIFGRAKPLGQLTAARDRVARTGGVELVWVSAEAGLGKSALLRAFGDGIVTTGGLVARTTFRATDTAPYAGLARLLADLAGHLMLRCAGQPAGWRTRLAEELGGTAPVLAALAPELAPLVDVDRPYPAPRGAPAVVLLRLGVRRLLSAVAGTDGPLALLLDDVHRAEPETIDVLHQVCADPQTSGLLVVGAYRPRELPEPLARLQRERGPWRGGGPIGLRPLPDSVLAELLADTLHVAPTDAAALARVVAERTGSRPLAVAEFLRELGERRILKFDEHRGWRFDRATVAQAPPVLEIASAVHDRLIRLPPRLLRMLQVAAGLGGPVAVTTLAGITGLTRDGVLDLVRAAVREGLLAAQPREGDYRWTHEVVRQAVRTTLGDAQRRELDAAVGRTLLNRGGPGDAELVVRLCGGTTNGDEEDRARLAERALAASRRAYRLGALDTADDRMRTAVELVPPGRVPLAYAVHAWAARTAWDAGHPARAWGLLDVADRYAVDPLSRARILALRARWHRAEGTPDQARTDTAQALKLLDVEPTRRLTHRALGAPTTDPRVVLAQEVIADALDLREPLDEWATLLAATGVRLAYEYGPTPAAALAFAAHAVALADLASPSSARTARLALTVRERCPAPGLAARVAPVAALVRALWYEPDALTALDEGYRAGIEDGEPARALDNRVLAIAHRFVLGSPLSGLADEVDEVRALADRYGLPDPTGPVAGAIARLRDLPAPLTGSVPALVAAHLLGDALPDIAPAGGLLGAVATVFGGLARAGAYPAADPDTQRRIGVELAELQTRLDEWATSGPATFGAYALLLAAERARLTGDAETAEERYGRAVDLAREHGLVPVEGLAAELGGRYALSRGQTGPAVAYLRRARDCYQRWRAPALVAHVDRTLAAVPSRPDRTFDQLDLLAMVRAFQAIAGELSPDRLVVTLLELLVEHTHAERGALLLPVDGSAGGRLTVAASAHTERGRVTVRTDPVPLPGSVIAYVHRHRRPVGGTPDELAVDLAREHGLVPVEGLAAELGGRYALSRGQTGPAVAYLRRARDCYQRWRAPALVAHVDRTLAAVPSRPDRTFDQLDLLAMVRAFQAIAGELSPDRLVVTLLELLVEHTHA
ncbi:MAG: hypothetical protein AUG44_19740, partial [Actinobacteria bacterium 13_1_20CM_3_71_11]